MKYLLSAFILVIGLGSCKTDSSSSRPSGSELEINWGVVSNSYKGETLFLSELKIVNKGKVALVDTNWTLYFDFSPCRQLLKDSMPDFAKLTHIGGDFVKIQPTAKFKGINPGDTLTIRLVGSPWVIKETDAPGGFYFVFNENGNDLTPEVPAFVLIPFTTPEQLTRSSADKLEVPTAASRYEKFQNVSLIPQEEVQQIIPTPVSYKKTAKNVELTDKFTISYEDGLENEAKFLSTNLKQNLGVALPIAKAASNTKNSIVLKLENISIDGKKYSKGSEAYSLTTDDSQIIITGADAAGVFYGVQSLRTLLPVSSYAKVTPSITLQGIEVKDFPRFAYRGMLLDVGRNFHSKASVLKLLDMMSLYKLNKFHFHLVDDEGWRIEINGLPELTEVGSKRGHTLTELDMQIPLYGSGPFANDASSAGSGYYTRADFIEILKYATERHIEVIPELDMPGHARAAIKSMEARYQKYIQKGDSAKANEFLLHDRNDKSSYYSVQNYNDNVVCVCQSSTYRFLEVVLDDMMKMFKEANAPLTTIHTGGDEVPHGVWEKSPVCEQLMKENPALKNAHDLKAYFLKNFSSLINKRSLVTAGWEEIGLHLEKVEGQEQEIKTVNPDYVNSNFQPYIWNSVYGWGGEETGYKLANAGYKIVLSNVTHLYLDMAYDKDPKEPGFYWGGFITTEDPYLFEPTNLYNSLKTDANGVPIPKAELAKKTKLTEAGKKNVLGIQGQLWSETVKSPERIEYMIFPRLITLAERAWAPSPQWTKNENLYKSSWNAMANAIGQRELPRMDYLNGGVNYRVPIPGAIVKDGMLYANSEFPGVVIRYTTDGSEPTKDSPLYTAPVKVSGTVKIRSFSSSGRAGRSILLHL